MSYNGTWKTNGSSPAKICCDVTDQRSKQLVSFSLKNKRIIVFGGAGKIGFPIATGLASAGANVIIASRNATKASQTLSYNDKLKIDFIDVDASDERAMREIFSGQNYYSGCVFCSTIRPMTEYLDSDISAWRESMLINSTSLYLSNVLAAEHMKNHDGGSILNISSVYGMRAPDPNLYEGTKMGTEPDYPFVKGGTIALTKYMAVNYGSSGVRFNCIAPGGLEGNQPTRFKEQYNRKVPLGRMMKADDLEGPSIFLMSDASKYLTGVTIPVDGGFTL